MEDVFLLSGGQGRVRVSLYRLSQGALVQNNQYVIVVYLGGLLLASKSRQLAGFSYLLLPLTYMISHIIQLLGSSIYILETNEIAKANNILGLFWKRFWPCEHVMVLSRGPWTTLWEPQWSINTGGSRMILCGIEILIFCCVLFYLYVYSWIDSTFGKWYDFYLYLVEKINFKNRFT